MTEVQVMIVDDEPLARERLQQLVDDLPGYRVCASCGDAVDAMEILQESVPDVVLLDIAMPGMNGLELARFIDGLEVSPAIIFCTAYDDHALPAFATGATGYLLKPVREGNLLECLEGARRINRMQLKNVRGLESRSVEAENFCIESHRGVELIPVHAVTHLMADQKYVTLFHDGGEALMETSLKAIEESYPQNFVRVHRNTLVNVEAILGIKRNGSGEAFLRLRGTSQEPRISRRHLKDVKQLLSGNS